MDKRKRKLKKRAKKRAKGKTNLITRLTNELKELAKDKTPPEVVDAHVDYYSKCNETEQEILMKIFKSIEDKQTTELLEYHSRR